MFSRIQILNEWLPRLKAGEKADAHLALNIAVNALFDKKTRDGKPYILHPIEVAQGTMSNKKRIACILHDVVEDSDWTLDDLRLVGFDEEIVMAVDAVTKRDGEKYFDFIVRGAQNGELGIDVKLSDLTHNLDQTRNRDIDPTDKMVWKQKAYNISYAYLVDIKKGIIKPGTSMFDYIKNTPEYESKPEIVNELMDRFSDDSRRFDARSLNSIFSTIKQAQKLEL